MSFKPFLQLLQRKQLQPALAANALYGPFYKVCYIAALKSSGVMDRLSGEAVTFERLAATYAPGPKAREGLAAWLQMGCRLGLLGSSGRGYELEGLAKTLALPRNDATLALLQEVAGLHHRLITETPAKLRAGEPWTLDDQDGELTARSSRALEVFQLQALDRFLPASGPCHLLEVGCGSAVYIRHAAMRNPLLTAVGIELQEDVARMARENVRNWGLADRVTIGIGDIRTEPVAQSYDVATLYNNIYYFAVEERVGLLARVKAFLEPGGALLLTTCCQGGNLGIEALNLWGASNAHGGRLPAVAEMVRQLDEAGYRSIETMRLIPGDSFHAFHARR